MTEFMKSSPKVQQATELKQTKPHITFSRQHLPGKTRMKIKTELVPSNQSSTKKPHDTVSPAEWQFYSIMEVSCKYSCRKLQAKPLADTDASFIIFPSKLRRTPLIV